MNHGEPIFYLGAGPFQHALVSRLVLNWLHQSSLPALQMAYILENKISIFSLALIFSSFCLASSTKDFSYSFLREDGKDKEAQNKAVDEPEAGKEAVELREEGVDSRDLQSQLLDEANKVEEAVRRLGSFRGSDKQEGKEQYKDKDKEEEEKVEVVVSKSEAVLLCSFFKDRARLPD